jgi:hypothetical protein
VRLLNEIDRIGSALFGSPEAQIAAPYLISQRATRRFAVFVVGQRGAQFVRHLTSYEKRGLQGIPSWLGFACAIERSALLASAGLGKHEFHIGGFLCL